MQAADPDHATYRVLARTYRPGRLSELIGQEALVRTLTNAFAAGRLAHAFMLTGIRGVGKTTTARIIARALNCIGPDGDGGPTSEPCGVCTHCQAIGEGRHIDVLELDAASHTGIGDVREIIDNIRYAPSAARSKVTIVDEVHMLSQQAFNGLLKTLEEPPPHATFVFATTEIRRVPVTVLSRCQRFDLKRVEPDVIKAHLARIAERERVEVEPAALDLIARCAEGSVRDSLSLLDQAIALTGGRVGALDLQDMLGLVDRGRLLGLFDALMRGDARGALERVGELDALGADPVVLVQDLLDLCHGLTRLKVVPEAAEALGLGPEDTERARGMAGRLSMPVLARCWQMLLRGIDDLKLAPLPMPAFEMLLLRLAHIADLPTPDQLGLGPPAAAGGTLPVASATAAAPRSEGALALAAAPAPEALPTSVPEAPPTVAPAGPEITGLKEAIRALQAAGEPLLASYLHQSVHLVRFEPGRLELRFGPNVPAKLPAQCAAALERLTGRRWVVTVSNAPGDAPLAEQEESERATLLAAAAEHPDVRRILEQFPGATLATLRERR